MSSPWGYDSCQQWLGQWMPYLPHHLYCLWFITTKSHHGNLQWKNWLTPTQMCPLHHYIVTQTSNKGLCFGRWKVPNQCPWNWWAALIIALWGICLITDAVQKYVTLTFDGNLQETRWKPQTYATHTHTHTHSKDEQQQGEQIYKHCTSPHTHTHTHTHTH